MKTVEEVAAAIQDAGLGHRTETILPLVRPSVRITYGDTPADALPVGASRIGGLPDLPPEFEWPAFSGSPDHSGGYNEPPGPQCLLAQINLADVAPHDAEGLLPRTGVLYFFAATWINAITYSEWEEGREPWSVLFYDGDSTRLAPRPLPPLPKELVEDKSYQFNQGQQRSARTRLHAGSPAVHTGTDASFAVPQRPVARPSRADGRRSGSLLRTAE